MTTSHFQSQGRKRTILVLRDCTVIGSAGYDVAVGSQVKLAFTVDDLSVMNIAEVKERISFPEICELSIAGPGTVTSGGGFIGGGFGVEGAIEGMAIAGLLNALTTRSKIHTYLSFVCLGGELHFHLSTIEPGALRIAMAEVFTGVRRWDPGWRQAALGRLELVSEVLGEERASVLRSRMLKPTPSEPTPPVTESGPTSCSACGAIVPWLSQSCRKCGAAVPKASAARSA